MQRAWRSVPGHYGVSSLSMRVGSTSTLDARACLDWKQAWHGLSMR